METWKKSYAVRNSNKHKRGGFYNNTAAAASHAMNGTYSGIIQMFADKKVLVIGDFILDIYLKGTSTRLSPEAPVPVVDIAERTSYLGGAANTACNLKALGAEVTYCSVIGNDKDGEEAIQLMSNAGVDYHMVVQHSRRKTIVKTRIVAGSHVVTRFDCGSQEKLDKETTDQLKRFIESKFSSYDAIVFSDYDKGIITGDILDSVLTLQKKHSKFIAVDSKRLGFFKPLQPSLIKPNYEEVLQLLHLPHQYAGRAEQMKIFTDQLYETTGAAVMAITLDAEGSVVAEKGTMVHRCFSPSVASPHVAGAGDTYLSAFVLAFISCGNSRISSEIATAAASVAITKECTSTCTSEELKAYFSLDNKYVESVEELQNLCDEYHSQGRRIVFTNGCFDILHSGHVSFLHCAKKMGDVLIVAINSDDSIKRIKGSDRPINPLHDRLEVLSALSSVDRIIAFGHANDDTPMPLINIVRPHVFAKGGDYTKDKLPEASLVEKLGGEIVFIPYVADHSTTDTIQRIHRLNPANKRIKAAIRV